MARLPQEAAQPEARRITRVVIQRVRQDSSPVVSFRLVAYQDGRAFQPVEFKTLDLLIPWLKSVHRALEADAFLHDHSPAPQILFAEDISLSDTQLAAIGLIKKQ